MRNERRVPESLAHVAAAGALFEFLLGIYPIWSAKKQGRKINRIK